MRNDERSPEEMFEFFLLRARYAILRAWIVRALLRGLVWTALMLGVAICFREAMNVTLARLFVMALVVSVAMTAICLWHQRSMVVNMPVTLDGLYGAEGRIASAAEFIQNEDVDPYKRLAIAEAGYWMATHSNPLLGNRPVEIYLIVPAILLVYLACRLT